MTHTCPVQNAYNLYNPLWENIRSRDILSPYWKSNCYILHILPTPYNLLNKNFSMPYTLCLYELQILYTRFSRKSSFLRKIIVKYKYGNGTYRKKNKRNSFRTRVIATKIWRAAVSFTRHGITLGKRQKCTNNGVFDCNRNQI